MKLRGILRDNNRLFLKDQLYEGLDFSDFIGTVYDMLLDEDEDPDEILVRIGIIQA